AYAAMPLGVEEIRRMRGGAQAHLMRCADDNYYVVKFQNNPQGRRILANELLATRLAARMGLPVAGAGAGGGGGNGGVRGVDRGAREIGRGGIGRSGGRNSAGMVRRRSRRARENAGAARAAAQTCAGIDSRGLEIPPEPL